MDRSIKDILNNGDFSAGEIIKLLNSDGDDRTLLFKSSAAIKEKHIGNKVWFRGLIEFSNVCGKDCLYCGIRKGNKNLERYSLDDNEILAAAEFAYKNRYGSIALQSGELESSFVTGRIEGILRKIREMSNGEHFLSVNRNLRFTGDGLMPALIATCSAWNPQILLCTARSIRQIQNTASTADLSA
jgi:biotin synthase